MGLDGMGSDWIGLDRIGSDWMALDDFMDQLDREIHDGLVNDTKYGTTKTGSPLETLISLPLQRIEKACIICDCIEMNDCKYTSLNLKLVETQRKIQRSSCKACLLVLYNECSSG